MTKIRRFLAPFAVAACMLLPACGGDKIGWDDLDPEPLVTERVDGKIPVKPELIRRQVLDELDGVPEIEAQVARRQQIEADHHACRLLSDKAKKTTEKVFANCMARRGYLYMFRHDAEQLHNDIEFEVKKARDKRIAAEQKALDEQIAAAAKAEEERQIVERKAEEERIAAEKKRQEEAERARRQKALDDALVVVLNARKYAETAEVKRLIDDGANVNTKGKSGWTPLHIAAQDGQTKAALAFIKAGAYIGAKDNKDQTPLHLAALNGNAETCFALVKAGADIEVKTNKGLTPLHLAVSQGLFGTVLALIKTGADVDAKMKGGFTPLHVAALQGKTRIALALIKTGADVFARADGGKTPLDIAIKEHPKNSKIVRALQEAMGK
ncbi:MAG: ankyrin repeat domain-containing protein [Gammaproteobacteria bacterium]